MSDFTIHKALLLAEEMQHLFVTRPVLGALGRAIGAVELTIKKEALQPAEMEFLGRRITDKEYELLMMTFSLVITNESVKRPCSAFGIAHVLYHTLNAHDVEKEHS